MNAKRLVGEKIHHTVFGSGLVIRTQGEDYIVADFNGTERMFEYPAAFSQYLTADDESLRPFLPACTPVKREKSAGAPRRGRPVKSKKGKSEGFIRDEYDTYILADILGCTL